MKKYNWGIIGTGVIAHEMGKALKSLYGEIYGVCSGKYENAIKFAEDFPVKKCFETEEDLLQDKDLDIVYIATPHSMHYKQMKNALENNKHVFCEKAITVNSDQLKECMNIAREKHLVICDGTTILHMPLYKKIKEMIDKDVIGKVKMIQVNFGSCKEYDINNRFFSKDLAGGGLLDIGVYAITFARYFMKEKPDNILTTVNYFETGVDETSGMILKNTKGEMAVVALTMRAKQPKCGVISGEKGFIQIQEYPRANEATITYTKDNSTEIIKAGESKKALEYEVLDMEEYISNNSGENNITIVNEVMDILTKVREQWGMTYNCE